MQIQNGKLYENRTWFYLYPCLRFYGEDLMDQLSKFFKVGVGVGDVNYEKKGNSIFILFDMNLGFSEKGLKSYRNNFSAFLSWLSYQPYYVDDYIYDEKKFLHMVVIKIPRQLNETYLDFTKGNYSKMYSEKSLECFFDIKESSNAAVKKRNERIKKVRKVLTRDKSILDSFVQQVNERFGTKVSKEAFKEAELDFPPDKKDEFFNYGEG